MQIAFYKAEGKIFDKLIRWWTGGRYSHCELVFSDGVFFSSSPRDGGVRYKTIQKDLGKWDFVGIRVDKFDENVLRRWCDSKVGRSYDWLGIALTQALPLGMEDPERYFCSEIIVDALQHIGRFKGFTPSEVTPQKLYNITK